MAKKKKISSIEILNNADVKHSKHTEHYAKMVDALYMRAVDDISKLVLQMRGVFGEDTFSFGKDSEVDKKVNEVISNLCNRIGTVIDSGTREEWLGACMKSNEFIESILNTTKLTKQTLQKYQDRNLAALASFQERKVNGLNLSERIWKYVAPIKEEVELAVDTSTKYYKHGINSGKTMTKIDRAIGQGTSAAELSREIRSCLKDSNKLFRRVRDKYGNLTLSKAAKLYHPGQGVYRSSYKNAMRMTRTEINMSYRQSDHLRWQQLDFVVGIEVQTSNNHTTLNPKGRGRIELHDMCDVLAGKYPKDFKFIGWHPQCRCFATPILKTLKEIEEEVDDYGNYRSLPSASSVDDVPQGFKDYVKDNEERMKGWSSVPYYLKDNPQYVDKALYPEKYDNNALSLDLFQQKTLSEMEMYSTNHEDNERFTDVLARAKKAVLDGDQDVFDAETRILRALYEQNPDGSLDELIRQAGVPRLPAGAKHVIYEKDINDQFVEIYESENGKKVYLHVLKYRDEEDYERLIKAAKLYALDDDVYILPEIHKSETGIRTRLGIGTETKVPDMKVGSKFIDNKAPLKWSNIVSNANGASKQGAIACITDDFCEIRFDSIENLSKRILGDRNNYSQEEVHFLVGGTLYKFNGQGRILGQGFAPSRGASNAFVSRGAKIGTNSNTEINAGKENVAILTKEDILKVLDGKKKIKFNSVEDAVAYIKTNIADDVRIDIKKGDLDIIGEIVGQMENRMKVLSIDRFSYIGKPSSKVAVASWDEYDNSIKLNLSALRHPEKIWEKEMKYRKKGIRYSAYTDADDVIRSTIDHELGHKLLSKYDMLKDAANTASIAGKTINGFNELDEALGYYASTDEHEFFAESFAAYLGKERSKMVEIAKMIERLFDKLPKNAIVEIENIATKAQPMRRKIRIAKRKKRIDPKEERHKYDSRIDIINKWKDAYDLDVSKIEDAYIRASIAGIESALVEQETLLKSRKKEVDDAKSRLASIGGDASKYVVKEDKNYKLVLLRIEKEIRKIEEFNAFYAQNKASIELALEDGRLWGVRNDYMEDLEQYVKDKNSFGIKDRIRLINSEVQSIKAEYESYKKMAKTAIEAAKSVAIDYSGVELQLMSLEKNPSLWKTVRQSAIEDVNALVEKARNALNGDVPNPALKKDYQTNEDVNDSIRQIQANLPDDAKWFEHGDLLLKLETHLGNNGSTDMRGTILLTSDRLKGVRSALGKIAQGRSAEITFEESDAMATFWHEITHNRNKLGNLNMTTKQTRFMELANEFTARKSLDEFYRVLGCKVPHPEFMNNRDSTGYNKWVRAYDHVIDACGLNRDSVTRYIRERLFNESYKDQKTTLQQALIEGGIRKVNGSKMKVSEINKILDLCLMKPTLEQMDELLRQLGYIV